MDDPHDPEQTPLPDGPVEIRVKRFPGAMAMLVDCNARRENGVVRVDAEPYDEAHGYHLDGLHRRDGVLMSRRPHNWTQRARSKFTDPS